MPPLSEVLLIQLSALVEARLGLFYPRERLAELEKAVRAAAGESSEASSEDYLRLLLNAAMSDSSWKILSERLTVGETYFFREKPSFTALERHLLPNLIATRRAQGRLRLRFWSAGCCTGEEPYSLAILLTRLLPDIADWNVTILATDINAHFLQKAAEGVYGDWSFRNAPSWLKSRFFCKTAGGKWAVQSRIKQMVTLRSLNLASDDYPSASSAHAMDVILCRNVLLYMSPKQTKNVIRRLRATLSEGGWLNVSPAEASAIYFGDFTTATICGATLYQKMLPSPSPIAQPPPVAASMLRFSESETLEQESAFTDRELTSTASVVDALACARACADAGELAQALAWSDQAIAEEKVDAVAYYLRAVILQEQGALEQAADSLRHALKLNSSFILAHIALGSLARNLGREAEALEHFLQARALLQRASPDDNVPEADGIAAGRLLEMVDMMLTEEQSP